MGVGYIRLGISVNMRLICIQIASPSECAISFCLSSWKGVWTCYKVTWMICLGLTVVYMKRMNRVFTFHFLTVLVFQVDVHI